MENQPASADPHIPPGETLLWQGRPSIWTWSEGNATYLVLACLVMMAPVLLLIMLFSDRILELFGVKVDKVTKAALLFSFWPLCTLAAGLALVFLRGLFRNRSTRYLITDQSVILVRPFGSFVLIHPRRENYQFRSQILSMRKSVPRGQGLDIQFGKERHHYGGSWLAAGKELWVTLAIRDCPDAKRAEAILEELHGPGNGTLPVILTDLFSQRASGEKIPFLEGPNRSSVLFLTGKNTPLSSLLSPWKFLGFAGKTDEEILQSLVAKEETVLWTGRPSLEPYLELDRFQKIVSLVAIVLSPLLIWFGFQLIMGAKETRGGVTLIFFGVFLVVWADNIFLGRWSVKRIISRAFYCITDRRVLVVHPFGPNLQLMEQPFYSFDRLSIAQRILCQTPQGMAIIFQSKETLSGNDQLEIENIGIVACPDWARAEEVLVKWFDQDALDKPT